MMTAVPFFFPVILPFLLTVTTERLLLDHLAGLAVPVMLSFLVCPFASVILLRLICTAAETDSVVLKVPITSAAAGAVRERITLSSIKSFFIFFMGFSSSFYFIYLILQ